jgi:hypothetical protein
MVPISIPDGLGRELYAALTACAEDLEAEIRARYNDEMLAYPVMSRRFNRDMEPVYRARKAALMLRDFGVDPSP